MKDIVHIVGNRPQFIKLAVLHEEIRSLSGAKQKIIHTGQHASAEMSDIFFQQLDIPTPDVSLQAAGNGHPDSFISDATIKLQDHFSRHPNSIAFVYGDTNTTLAASIAATRVGINLFHFEAGIRTGERLMPEELNRVLTDRLSETNYCCTQRNYDAMLAEGYGSTIDSRVIQSGDLMLDAYLKILPAEKNVTSEQGYVACTIHRAGNIISRERLSAIVDALNSIHQHMPVIVPLHPHTEKRMMEYGLQPAFQILQPLGYPQMKALVNGSSFVITDSGGAAREAFFSAKKSVIVMERPFWPEIVEAGCAISTAAKKEQIVDAFERVQHLDSNFQTPIFGTGNAAHIIAKDLLGFISN